MPYSIRLISVSLYLSIFPAIYALAQNLPIDINALQMVNLPQHTPRLTILTREPIRDLRVSVTESGKSVISKSFVQLGAGAVQYISWSAEPGVHNYRIEVSGITAAGQASASSETVVTVMRPLEILLQREWVDLETRRIPFRINNPPGHVEISIFNAASKLIHEADIDLRARTHHEEIELSWPQLKEPIARIELKIFDISDSWVGVELLPFRVEIPHVDVVFETNKWKILPNEKPKLDDAYERLVKAIAEHGDEIKARVYILGHTDTVGSDQDNMVLSKNRANAIARYFMAKGGITLPILACGFGETMLAVKTADDVDEQRNRRAQYILAAEAPLPCNWVVVSRAAKK
ncbi:MAG: OmpA family protein [Deltaproteobacteria bacterium]|nr:OmpA family protein [Deltaproteobacteria bacterium]